MFQLFVDCHCCVVPVISGVDIFSHTVFCGMVRGARGAGGMIISESIAADWVYH